MIIYPMMSNLLVTSIALPFVYVPVQLADLGLFAVVSVLVLVAMGHTNQEAAARLGVSPKSVEGYRRRMAQKIGASSRADIVRFALRNGLLSSPS